MTRKEELKQRVITIVDEFPIYFETETEKKEYQEYVVDMLQKVEREVLERVDRRNIQAITGDWKPEESILLKHDAEQRRVIDELRQELALLKQDDIERCILIRDMEEEERRKDAEIEEARRTAEYWKAEHLAGNTKIEQLTDKLRLTNIDQLNTESELNACQEERRQFNAKIEQQAQQIATLREVLTNLYELVEGECPNLLNEDSGGDAQLAMEIEQALKEVKE